MASVGAKETAKEPIVIVGGGYGGFSLANALKKANKDFTLISIHPVFYHNVASVRTIVRKDFDATKLMISLKDLYGSSLTIGTMIDVSPEKNCVVLQTGEMVKYSSLVLATGTSGNFPYSLPADVESKDGMCREDVSEEDAFIQSIVDKTTHLREKIEAAQRILVVGGGATGVEQACEISSAFPDKKVTIIHRSDTLVRTGFSQGFYDKVNSILDGMNIRKITGEGVSDLDSLPIETVGAVTVSTDKGTELEVDLILRCTGLRVNSSAYKTTLGGCVDDAGRLQVDKYLRVEGHDNIYAIGDCNSMAPQLAYAAGEQAELLVKNLVAKQTNKKLTEWESEKFDGMMLMGMGPSQVVGQMPGGKLMPDAIAIPFKGKDLMVAEFHRRAGLESNRCFYCFLCCSILRQCCCKCC